MPLLEPNCGSDCATEAPGFSLDALLCPMDAPCPRGAAISCSGATCQTHLQRLLEKQAASGAPLGQALPWQVLWIFFPLNCANMHTHAPGPSRAAPLISPEGLVLLEIMRARTSYQLYQESFFPAKPVRALLSGNLGLKLLFSCFTDGLNE